MIGGPNGSGKSTLLRWLTERARADHFPLGFVQNPDAIEREIVKAGRLYLDAWGIDASAGGFDAFARAHSLFTKIAEPLPVVDGNTLVFEPGRSMGYLVPVLCDFFRTQWISSGESFTFETVMSGPDKLDVLKECRSKRYRTYLYYVCTDDVAINYERIENRVKQGGHAVPSDRVEKRYEGSLAQLLPAIKSVNRAYLFDNSGKEHRRVATFTNGRLEEIHGGDMQPAWFVDHVLAPLSGARSRRSTHPPSVPLRRRRGSR